MSVKKATINNLPTKKLLLAGAGHAHIGLLRRLTIKRPAHLDITLITEELQTIYSGMLPGWMAGHYHLDEISIDITSLCVQAGVRLIQRPIIKVDATSRIVTATDNETVDYDVLSLNTGADTDMRWLGKDKDTAITTTNTTEPSKFDSEPDSKPNSDSNSDTVIAIRPLSIFTQQWQQILLNAERSDAYKLAIVGAGAAATELVMSAQVALKRINVNHQVCLVCGDELLSGFDQTFRRRVIKQLKRHNIKIIYARATGYQKGQLMTSQGSLSVDAVIAATGVVGSGWTKETNLEIAGNGFIAVNATQQSISHSNVFAVGDVATRVDQEMAHSGVHAVHGGAVEADNILSYLADEPLQTYQPRSRTLYLLSCGDKYAIGSWGNHSLQGRWIWYLKRRIDKRFIKASQFKS